MKTGSYVYQYFSLFHHRRLFNGSSGYTIFSNGIMRNADLPLEGWTTFFRVIGVKFIVSHSPDFVPRVIESAWRDMKRDLQPLSAPDSQRPNSIVIMDPVERAIYQNVLTVKKIFKINRRLGVARRGKVYPADVGKDKFIIDLGHDTARLIKPETIPQLPKYVVKEGNVLVVTHRNLEKMLDDLGSAAHFILLHHGIDRLEVHGFRYLFDEKIKNPFYGLTEVEAKKMGLSKIVEADGSVIWRIDSKHEPQLIKEAIVEWSSSIDSGALKIEATVSVPGGTAWKNPNPFGCNRGSIKLRPVGQNDPLEYDFYLNLPLV